MRTENSVKNSTTATIGYMFQVLIGFITQKLFILILNNEYLGVNGLFSNILTMLSIAELGIGEAIIYHLYKPIAEDDKERIKSLTKLYKKSYNLIMVVIFLIGITLIPFLDSFIGRTTLDLNFRLIYILFLLQTVVSYAFAYKRSLLYAYQKNYIITRIHVIVYTIFSILEIALLYITKNYYLYLITKVLYSLTENIAINIYVNKNYSYINEKNVLELDKTLKVDIISRVKAQLLHRIGSIVIFGTDNIIISKFFGIYEVGLYTNYSYVISAVQSLIAPLISSATASVGNLLVEKDTRKSFEIFKKINFFNFWIAVFASTSVLVLMQDFITVWLGKEYLMNVTVLIILVLNLYQTLMRATQRSVPQCSRGLH